MGLTLPPFFSSHVQLLSPSHFTSEMSIMLSLSVLVHLPPSLTGYGNGPLTALPASTLLLAVHCPCHSQNEFYQMQTRTCHSRAESFQRLPSILRRKCGFLSPMVCDLPLPHQPPSPYSCCHHLTHSPFCCTDFPQQLDHRGSCRSPEMFSPPHSTDPSHLQALSWASD